MTLTTNYNTKLEYFIPVEYIYVDIGYVCILCMYITYVDVHEGQYMYVCMHAIVVIMHSIKVNVGVYRCMHS